MADILRNAAGFVSKIRSLEKISLNAICAVFKGEQEESRVLVDLTPNKKVSDSEIYFESLDEAIHNKNVTNIAITGPYGSGKSSIIKSYIKRYGGIFNQLVHKRTMSVRSVSISLADFDREAVPEKSDNSSGEKYSGSSDSALERSILQQLFYSVSADRLPQSKISRIRRVKKGHFRVITFLVFISSVTSIIYLYKTANLGIAFYIGTVLSLSISYLYLLDGYRFLKGNVIKRIAFRSINFELRGDGYDSLLNKYLDEIVYFFKETKKNVVFIEDLDRYNNSDIFIRLREINILLNAEKEGHGQINFVYAIKDSFFKDKERAKFFDVIIPLVPVISPTNSREAIQGRAKKEGWNNRLDRDLVKIISMYVYDYRLIHNIFNEYKVYLRSLSDLGLDYNKLLAIVVYKNLYPSDFNELHDGGGRIVEFFDNFYKHRKNLLDDLRHKIAKNRDLIRESDEECIANLEELRRLYVSYIYELVMANPNRLQNNLRVRVDGKRIPINGLIDEGLVESLFDTDDILIAGGAYPGDHRIGRMSDIEEKTSSKIDYFSRKKRVVNKNAKAKRAIFEAIDNSKEEIARIENARVSSLVDRYPALLDSLGDDFSLVRALIRSGYIDENYPRYISRFYEGSLTLRDLKYISLVREGGKISFALPVDNPKEVIEELGTIGSTCFEAINVHIFSHTIENARLIGCQKFYASFLQMFKRDNEIYKDFILSCLDHHMVQSVLSVIAQDWPQSLSVLLKEVNNPAYKDVISSSVVIFIRKVDKEILLDDINSDRALTDYVNENPNVIVDFITEEHVELLKSLEFKVSDIEGLSEIYSESSFESVVDLIHNNELYVINVGNIEYIRQFYSKAKISKEDCCDWQAIVESGDISLFNYLNERINEYVENVFLRMGSDVFSNDSAVNLLSRSDISEKNAKKIINSKNFLIKNLAEVDESLWVELFRCGRVESSWENIQLLVRGCSLWKDAIRSMLDGASENFVSGESTDAEVEVMVRDFVVYEYDCGVDNFERVIDSFSFGKLDYLDQISSNVKPDCRIDALLERRLIALNSDTFSVVSEVFPDKVVSLITTNLDAYICSEPEFPLGKDDFRDVLAAMSSVQFEKFVNSNARNVSEIIKRGSSAPLADRLCDGTAYKISNKEVVSILVKEAEVAEGFVKLLTKYNNVFLKKELLEVLRGMKHPYSTLVTSDGDQSHRELKLSDVHLQLANILVIRGLISSIKVGKKSIRILNKKNALS